ncbi:MAG: signal peptidase I [Eubacteriales bacterium]
MKSKSIKKTLSIVGNVLLWLFVAFAVFMTVLVFSSQSNKESIPNIMGKSLITIQSDSMKPEFKKGDLIIDKILTNDEKKELKVGDIITYYVDLNGDGEKELNTHRIVDVYEDGGYVYYVTKGDNKETNPVNDKDPVMHPYVLAKYTGTKIGGVGKIISFLQTSVGFMVVIVIPLVIFFLFELYNFISIIVRMKGKGKISKEEEEEIKKRAIEEYLRQQEEKKESEK